METKRLACQVEGLNILLGCFLRFVGCFLKVDFYIDFE